MEQIRNDSGIQIIPGTGGEGPPLRRDHPEQAADRRQGPDRQHRAPRPAGEHQGPLRRAAHRHPPQPQPRRPEPEPAAPAAAPGRVELRGAPQERPRPRPPPRPVPPRGDRQAHRPAQGPAEGKRTAIEISYKISQEKLDQLEKELADLLKQATDEHSAKMAPFLDAKNEYERQQLLLDQIQIRYTQESVEQGVAREPAHIASIAEPNPTPVEPRLLIYLPLSGIAGLLLGLAVAFFIEYLDTSIKTPRRRREDPRHPRPHPRPPRRQAPQPGRPGLPARRMLPDPPRPDRPPGRRTRRQLHHHAQRRPRRGQVHHPLQPRLRLRPGGPSPSSSSTPTSGAPPSTRSSASPSAPGLSDYLIAGGSILSYVQATPVPNLHIVVAGSRPASAKDHFSGQALRQLLDELKASYAAVLIDSPPALGVSDASTICHEVDKTVLVLQHRRYPRDVSLRAKRAVEEVQGNLVGVVFKRRRPPHRGRLLLLRRLLRLLQQARREGPQSPPPPRKSQDRRRSQRPQRGIFSPSPHAPPPPPALPPSPPPRRLQRHERRLGVLRLPGLRPLRAHPPPPPPGTAASPGAPATPDNDLLRVGDVVTVRLSGVPQEDTAIYEIKIGDDGNISMPLLAGSFHAAGATASQLKDQIEAAYRDHHIYSSPNVIIIPESRFVNVSGEIRAPQRIAFTNDLTALRAITACGGFTDYADRRPRQDPPGQHRHPVQRRRNPHQPLARHPPPGRRPDPGLPLAFLKEVCKPAAFRHFAPPG